MNIDCSIAVGDLGIGFPNDTWPHEWNLNHRFIRGNHDNPETCKNSPNYLGDFGFLPEQDIYYVSGAWSIDHAMRIEGIDHWKEEELSYPELYEVVKEVQQYKPKIIVSHDCPSSIRAELFGFNKFYDTKTGNALNSVFETHQPDLWIFGHYHRGRNEVIDSTRFICLQELEMFEIPDIKW